MPARDNYSVRDYGRMIADGPRTSAFVTALRAAVRPGSTVLDIGSGPGYFALLACHYGAARVYAVEPDASIGIGRETASRLGLADRIVWLRGLSTEIELPERVDVVIADLHGILPFYTGNLVSMIDAKRRHLRPGGAVIPLSDTLHAAPATAADEYQDVVEPWERNAAGVDLSEGRRYVVNQWWRAAGSPIAAERYLAAPQAWATIDYRTVESPTVGGSCEWQAARDGDMHGYYVWFDSMTHAVAGFSNAPTAAERVYGRAFFPLERPAQVRAGDRIQCDFSAHFVAGEYVLRWSTRIRGASGALHAAYSQSDFAGNPRLAEDLALARPEHRPELSDAARVDLCALQEMAAGHTLSQIAERLSQTFPKRFGTPADALRHVADLSIKYSRS